MHMENMMQPKQVMVVEPYVYAATSTLVGKRAVLETTRGRVAGLVMDVKPDHVVLQERESTFFVRLCEVVWIMPDTSQK
ncbi:hypothetical protein CJ195_03660 [Bacillus sp. UMB0899]|nr:hypothetical protein CJ195_03660 [Bacillus sp. UMB0899]